MTKLLFISIIAATLSLGSCTSTDDRNRLYDSGVSQELAEARRTSLKDIEYDLHFSIPTCKDSSICAHIDIGFCIDRQEEIIIDNSGIYNQLLLNILRVISQKYGHNL